MEDRSGHRSEPGRNDEPGSVDHSRSGQNSLATAKVADRSCLAPANVAAGLYVPLELRAVAVGLLSLLRNEVASVGTSLAQTLHERRDQFHSLRLGEYLDPFNSAVGSFTEQIEARSPTGDPMDSQQLACRQSRFAMLTFVLAFSVLLMKRSVAEKGAHAASEVLRWTRSNRLAMRDVQP